MTTIEPTRENRLLIERVTGPVVTDGPHAWSNAILLDLPCRQINGKQIIGYTPIIGTRPLKAKRTRFTIPKNHPWRGRPRPKG